MRISSDQPLLPPRLFADVALNRPFDQSFSYLVPPAMAFVTRIGSMVEVPLRGQVARGVVVDLGPVAKFKGPTKPLARVLSPEYVISAELMELARWVADYYWCSWGEALAAAAFFGLNDVGSKMEAHLALAEPDHWLTLSREAGPDGKRANENHQRVVHALLAAANDPMPAIELCEEAGVSAAVLQTMLKHGWLKRVMERIEREDDYPAEPAREPIIPTLTTHQAAAAGEIVAAIHSSKAKTFLLHGVTGSGKTEVYLRAIAEALRLGREAIVLVPEIALTPQTVGVLRSRLGAQVGVYHSRLTLGQKRDLWRRIAADEVRVLIGARSAIFAPFPRLGLVIVDEEHEATYKQSDAPRYHARDLAVWRAAKLGAVAVLGSATPSMESYHNAREGKYELLEMPDRVGPHASPVMTVIDMKRNLVEGAGDGGVTSLISPQLREAINLRLDRGEQTILLLNRRGFANQVICLACEKIVQCPHCDVSLTLHKAPRARLLCHWCGHSQPMPKKCPNPKCGAEELKALGLGTQKVEDQVREAFPAARITRVDVDSTKGRRGFIDVWEKIARRDVDIILGTQMIAKGFHLESVTLVGVISADFALFLPDFRGAERTFHLLTQVAGRAGRGDLAGEVIVQSFIPHHYAIEHAARLQEREFFQRELHIRKMLLFPPLARLVAVLLTGEDLAAVREQSGRLANMLKSLARRPAYQEMKVLGPAPAPISRIEDRHRWRILLRGAKAGDLHELLRQGLAQFETVHLKHKVAVIVDVDPVDLL